MVHNASESVPVGHCSVDLGAARISRGVKSYRSLLNGNRGPVFGKVFEGRIIAAAKQNIRNSNVFRTARIRKHSVSKLRGSTRPDSATRASALCPCSPRAARASAPCRGSPRVALGIGARRRLQRLIVVRSPDSQAAAVHWCGAFLRGA